MKLNRQLMVSREGKGYFSQTEAARASKKLERSDPTHYQSFSQQWLSMMEKNDDLTESDFYAVHRNRLNALAQITGLDFMPSSACHPEVAEAELAEMQLELKKKDAEITRLLSVLKKIQEAYKFASA